MPFGLKSSWGIVLSGVGVHDPSKAQDKQYLWEPSTRRGRAGRGRADVVPERMKHLFFFCVVGRGGRGVATKAAGPAF